MRKKRKNFMLPLPSLHPHLKPFAYLAAALVVAAAIGILWVSIPMQKAGPAPTTFDECAALYPVHGTLPKTCQVPWGRTFVRYDGNFTTADTIRINLPPLAIITLSPFSFNGTAQQDWFSKTGTFEVDLVAGTGQVIATGEAKRSMPPGFSNSAPAPFDVTLTFTLPTQHTEGALVFKKSGSTQVLVYPIAF